MQSNKNDGGIIGNADVAPLYTKHLMDAANAKTRTPKASDQLPFIAHRTEMQKGQRITRTIVVMAVTSAEAMPKIKRIAKEYYFSHNAPWILNNGDSFYS